MKFFKFKQIYIDFLALLLALLYLILARLKMQEYMVSIQEFYPQAELLSQGTPSMLQLGNLIRDISPIVNKYLFFFYLTPFIVFVLFVLSQGINWQLNFNKKIDKKYLINFIIVSVPFLLVIGFFGVKLFSNFAGVLQGLMQGYLIINYLVIIYFILILVISYFYVMSIASLKKIENIKEGLIIAIKRFWPLFFIYLPFFIVSLVLFFIIFINFILIISESYSFGRFLISLVVIIVLLFIIDKYRKYYSGLFFSKKKE